MKKNNIHLENMVNTLKNTTLPGEKAVNEAKVSFAKDEIAKVKKKMEAREQELAEQNRQLKEKLEELSKQKNNTTNKPINPKFYQRYQRNISINGLELEKVNKLIELAKGEEKINLTFSKAIKVIIDKFSFEDDFKKSLIKINKAHFQGKIKYGNLVK